MANDQTNKSQIASLSQSELASLSTWERELSKATGQKIALVAYKVG
ncbi:MAG: hypothetical protein GX354_13220 [Firmicutes bacterium]|jgi:hypothetical protein|nr:hypothetical protein [Bacillota bacterium]